jgi:hypothetical protein
LAPPADAGSPLTEMSADETDTDDSSDSGDTGVRKIKCPQGLTRCTLKMHKEFLGTEDRDAEISEMMARLPSGSLFQSTGSFLPELYSKTHPNTSKP